MGRFASTAAVYAMARPPYGGAFFTAAARRLELSGRERLLDLGTGPGILALGFSPYVRESVAVDPEPAMAAAARAAVAEVGAPVKVIEGRAEDLPTSLGPFDMVTIGRALHWMEPRPLRAALDRLVGRRGSVVVCGARSAGDGANPWLSAYEDVRRRWSGGAEHVQADANAVFAESRFERRDAVAVTLVQEVSIGGLADRILSMSSSSPDLIGDGLAAMRADLAAALAPFAAEGRMRETIEARAEIRATL